MQEINEILSLLDSYIGGSNWFVFILLGIGLFFTIYLKFPQIRYFRHAIKIVSGKFDKAGDKGDTTHFQALATALSGTVGTGNIAGVALAIHLGGPSAVFWMIVTAALGMTTKFVEVTLSHKYREFAPDGSVAGGPMYYMKNKLNMKWLAGIFAVATVFSSFGTGNLPQINSIANSVFETIEIDQWITGLVLAVLLALVILGGIKRIAKVTEKLVPGMALIYFVGALIVIFSNFQNLGEAFSSIFTDVFTGTAAAGGFLGASINFAFNRGVNRGLFSNEAGQGSAPIAHASAKANEPVSEGMVAILEPFIDTIVICTLTALVILTSGVWKEKHDNIFQSADLIVLDGSYNESNENDKLEISAYLNDKNSSINEFDGIISVKNGKIMEEDITVLHARSFAENILIKKDNQLFSGSLNIEGGDIKELSNEAFSIKGKSLMHSAPLTTIAFTESYMGESGKYIVTIGLLLFAFSTAISWSYYGGRAMNYLFGVKSIIYYRMVYVVGFFIASFIDTTIVWIFSGITIALMTLPNLLGIFLLRRDMKETISQYWEDMSKRGLK